MPLRVLMLDVDGVITLSDGSGRLDDAKLEKLERLARATECVVCISSNWRHFHQLVARLELALQLHGGISVIGATPDHGERTSGASVRPEEIMAFLKAWRGEPITSWCAVDDRPLLEEQGGHMLEGHFVQVDERLGLTDKSVDQLIQVLLTDEPEEPELIKASKSPPASPDESRETSPDTVLEQLPPGRSAEPCFTRASEEHLRTRTAAVHHRQSRGARTGAGDSAPEVAAEVTVGQSSRPRTPRSSSSGGPAARPRSTPKPDASGSGGAGSSSRTRTPEACEPSTSTVARERLPPLLSPHASTPRPRLAADAPELLLSDGQTIGPTPGHRRTHSTPPRLVVNHLQANAAAAGSDGADAQSGGSYRAARAGTANILTSRLSPSLRSSSLHAPRPPSSASASSASARATTHHTLRPQRGGRDRRTTGWSLWGAAEGTRGNDENFMQRLHAAEQRDRLDTLTTYVPPHAHHRTRSRRSSPARPATSTDGGRSAGGSTRRREAREAGDDEWRSMP